MGETPFLHAGARVVYLAYCKFPRGQSIAQTDGIVDAPATGENFRSQYVR